jgi:hypothetical protein
MRLSRVLGTSATAGLLCALLFWLSCGPRLEYGVYAAGDSWYRDEFTPFGTLLVAAILGIAAALIVAAVLWIARRRARR